MKLSTRMRVSYFFIFLFPLILITVSLTGMMKLGLGSLEKRFDMDQTSFEMVINPTKMAYHMTTTAVAHMQQVIDKAPDRLKDVSFLDAENAQLANSQSGLVVLFDNRLYYNGMVFDQNLTFDAFPTAEGEGLYQIGDTTYRIYNAFVSFSDGHRGQAMIITNMDKVVAGVFSWLIRMILLSIAIMFVVTAMVMNWLHQSIVTPIGKLKVAAQSIAAGNLSYSVTAETEDEIGELCVAFEEMRLKLKGQIERNIQFEKESKELMSNISHDLKTPITSIKGYVEGLLDGVANTPEKQERYIRTILSKVNDMNSLIEELFLYAKLDSNSVTYNFLKMNVDGYFQDCVDEISLDMDAQEIAFSYSNFADRGAMIIADPEQLKRVINNIIGNAVKYRMPDRPLSIALRITEEAEFVRVEIEDNGKGIAKNEIPFIFDRCYRTDASRTSSQGGSGLGLSIAKKIIEEHGGKIWANSAEGMGTTLCFVLRKTV